VPEERVEPVAQAVGAGPVIFETIEFHDIAGLVRGASKGEGLGNRFLANIRETDAILHVVRVHGEHDVVHPEGTVDPRRDVETVEAELLLADLESAERRLERVSRQAKSGEKAAVAEETWLREVIAALGEGRPARALPPPVDAPEALELLQPLTAKPVLYVANVAESDPAEPPPEVAEHAAATEAVAVAISARIESELAELAAVDPEDAAEMRMGMGADETGLRRVVRAAFDLLRLITFFTADRGREATAHAVPVGTTAWEAAGKVHTDMQRGFVRAEVVPWDALVDAGGYAGARERGVLRVEGRDYEVRDGDVITVKFTR
jgi:GTP-binding protein YchF